jgi:hypothetical protein
MKPSRAWLMKKTNVPSRLWEGRSKSQALLDEGALLTCMAYVDLNSVRTGMADDLTTSDFTSIQQPLHEYGETKAKLTKVEKTIGRPIEKQRAIEKALNLQDPPKQRLMTFGGSSKTRISVALSIPYN